MKGGICGTADVVTMSLIPGFELGTRDKAGTLEAYSTVPRYESRTPGGSGWVREVAEVSVGDEFGGDADGDFGDGLGTDIEAERGVDLVEGCVGNAFEQEFVEGEFDLAAADGFSSGQ